MESIKIQAQVGEDGILSVRLPVKNQEVEAMVVYQSVQKKRQWSPGFFEKTCGCWEGEPLVREPQPEYQEREPLL